MVLVKKVLCFYVLLFCFVLRVTAMEQNQQMVTQVANYSAVIEQQGYKTTQTINTGYPILSLVTAPEHNKVACTVVNKTQGLVQLYSFKNNDDTKEIESIHTECVGTGDGGLAYCKNALYSANLKGSLKIWDVQNGTVTSTHQLEDPCNLLVVTPEKMVAGNMDGSASVYQQNSYQSSTKIPQLSAIYSVPMRYLLYMKDRVITNSAYNYPSSLFSCDVNSKSVTQFPSTGEVGGLSSLSQSTLLVGINDQDKTYLYCLDYLCKKIGEPLNCIGCEKKVTAVSSINPYAFVSGHYDGTVYLWDLRFSQKPVQDMKDYTTKVQALACLNEKSFFSASGSQLKLRQLK